MLENLLIGAENRFADHMSTELRAQENRYRTVCLQKGDMSWNSRTDVTGVSARVCDHGRYGFASSAEYTEASVRRVLRGGDNLLPNSGRQNRGAAEGSKS